VSGNRQNKKERLNGKTQLMKLPLLALFPIALLLVKIAEQNPAAFEEVYLYHIYPVISHTLNFITSFTAYSIIEILFYVSLLVLAVYIAYQLVQIFSNRQPWLRLVALLLTLACTASTLYFVFIGSWALNYHGTPLASKLGYDVHPRSSADLTELCMDLARQANELRGQVPEDEKGVFQYTEGKLSVLKRTPQVFTDYDGQELSRMITGGYGQPKAVLLSKAMSHTRITGIFMPFTMESNVNVAVPDLMLASTASHEAAHLHGVAREDEANYVAYLVDSQSDDVEFRYSATMMALNYAMDSLAGVDWDSYLVVYATYNGGLKRDISQDDAYWRQFEGKVAETATNINNSYLKTNGQSDGVHSYGRMVDLLLAAYFQNKS
jgi:hypothetical protein